ncbi:hypothetical protein [Sphingobium yanoikuyae]|uniref:hypothetical protein n=1 Tax=Sphingobium yanoikuyae TaxID=13690 RepID=UPI002FDEE643
MSNEKKPGWALQPISVTIADGDETFSVSDVDLWIAERKRLLRQARDIVSQHDGTAVSLYPHHARLIGIVCRLEEIRVIFDTFRRERYRHADANITALVAHFSDPEVMAGIDE